MSSESKIRIEVVGSKAPPTELPQEGMLVLGSSPTKAGLRLEGQGLAEVHCAIGRTKAGDWAIKDLGSEYGTLLNGKRVSQARLKAGDELLLGSVRLLVRSSGEQAGRVAIPTPAPAAPAAPKKKPAAPHGRTPNIKGYRIIERLGAGAMGEVFLAVQESLDREVALKVLSLKLEADTQFVASFQAEARAAAALNHPNVVTVHDVGEQDGVHFLTMEYMDRGSLEDRVASGGPLHWKVALEALIHAASGLVYAESRGIVHRDIKPDNLMQNHTGTTKIADLGLALRESDAGGSGSSKIFGTPHFISPEQVRGEKADCRSDLYSLGATAFRLLSGHTPFEGESTREILRAKLADEASSLDHFALDIPSGLVQVVQRLLRREPGERYPSAAALLKVLEGLSSSPEAAAVGAPPPTPKLPRWALPTTLALVAVALISLFTGGDGGNRNDSAAGGASGDILGDPADPKEQPAELADGDGPASNAQEQSPGGNDNQERMFEMQAENEFLKLGQRDLGKAARRDRLRELASRFLGTTAASQALAQADQLDAEVLSENRAQLEHDSKLGAILGALRTAADLAATPHYPGRALRAMYAVPGQDPFANDSAFVAARNNLEDAVVALALAAVKAGLERCDAAEAQGQFDLSASILGELIALTDLPDFSERRPPAGSLDLVAKRSQLRARKESLGAARERFVVSQRLRDVRMVARSLLGDGGLRGQLSRLDLRGAATHVHELGRALQTPERQAWAATLAADLELAAGAFEILHGNWNRWRRKKVPDPRDQRGTQREALAASAEGLRLSVHGKTQEVPWSAYANRSALLHAVFSGRLERAFLPAEERAIAAVMRFCAISETVHNASEMFAEQGSAVFTKNEAKDLPMAIERALEWEHDEERRASLRAELKAARILAEALQAGSEGRWPTAVSTLEDLLENHAETLLVLLASDGSLKSGSD